MELIENKCIFSITNGKIFNIYNEIKKCIIYVS